MISEGEKISVAEPSGFMRGGKHKTHTIKPCKCS